ncbi:MAG: PDDEXK nuclease domain-containing protein [Candidatus Gracilibacteria bacterium]|nr:PDDEXK nuclease domain-containing protein [Candidatus Gracilibacteria bacterium]
MLDTIIYSSIKNLLLQAKSQIVKSVNSTMVYTYFEIGKIIVEHEQGGNTRALYGKETLKNLSEELIKEFGKGFSVDNLENMRKFYFIYGKSQIPADQSQDSSKSETLSRKFELSWSHYLILIRLEEKERNFYEKETLLNNWSIRELQRQFDSALYERIILSTDKKGVLTENIDTYHYPENPKDILKDPYILEFLGLEESNKYSENEIEQAIIDKLEHFLLELGKGFTFVGRQQRFTFDEEHFFVDLVFYNRLLQCFVLIDLKIGKLKHQDLGQMQMYVNYYDRFVKTEHENKTIGIILCKDKKDTLVEITLPENSNIFASKYALYLPTKEELKMEIEGIES